MQNIKTKKGENKEMLHTSTATLTRAVELLNDSKNGILLIQSDSVSEYDQIARDWSCNHVHRKIVDNKEISYNLYPILYHKQKWKNVYIKSRNSALTKIFEKWSEYGKFKDSEPLNCVPFIKYLEQIQFYDADYMLAIVGGE